jgi:hypothetical protein
MVKAGWNCHVHDVYDPNRFDIKCKPPTPNDKISITTTLSDNREDVKVSVQSYRMLVSLHETTNTEFECSNWEYSDHKCSVTCENVDEVMTLFEDFGTMMCKYGSPMRWNEEREEWESPEEHPVTLWIHASREYPNSIIRVTKKL